jgi:hypothetical protein
MEQLNDLKKLCNAVFPPDGTGLPTYSMWTTNIDGQTWWEFSHIDGDGIASDNPQDFVDQVQNYCKQALYTSKHFYI